jgi:ribosomal protein S18 acetylase RimI-like enzyme
LLTADGIEVTMRPAVAGDAALLSRLDVATWASGHDGALPEGLLDSVGASPWHNETFWRTRIADRSRPHWVWLIETSEPIGYLAFGANTEPDWPDYPGEIERFYFVEGWRGRGIGSQVWRMAVNELTGAGLLPYLTTVFVFNAAAQRFYERQGGLRLGEQEAFVWNGEAVREFVYGFQTDDPRN